LRSSRAARSSGVMAPGGRKRSRSPTASRATPRARRASSSSMAVTGLHLPPGGLRLLRSADGDPLLPPAVRTGSRLGPRIIVPVVPDWCFHRSRYRSWGAADRSQPGAGTVGAGIGTVTGTLKARARTIGTMGTVRNVGFLNLDLPAPAPEAALV